MKTVEVVHRDEIDPRPDRLRPSCCPGLPMPGDIQQLMRQAHHGTRA
jgi:hypothetical protein